MEVLQLLLNIVGITGVTSLTLICFMVKRDNRALATEVRRLREQQRRNAPIIPEPGRELVAEILSDQSATPLNNDDVSQDDISQYVAQRAERWAALSVRAS